MGTRQSTGDGWFGCLGAIFFVAIAAAVWYFATAKRFSVWLFAPRYADYAHESAARLRRVRSWLGLLGAVVIYLVWRWGEAFGNTLLESAFMGPILTFFKLSATCFVAMLIVIVIVRRGERAMVLRQMGRPAIIVLSLVGVALGIGLYISGQIPSIDTWFPSNSTFAQVLAGTLGFLFFFVMLGVWLVLIPTSIEHCFSARDGHVILAPITFMLFAIWSGTESVQKFIAEGLPPGLPSPVGITLLAAAPATLLLISLAEMWLLKREGTDFRSANI